MRRRKQLGSADEDHLNLATDYVHKAWVDLERMPPTCEGGITIAARAWGYAERAQSELAAVGDRTLRKHHNATFALANRASNAAWTTLNYYSQVCKAPYSATNRVPLFSRAKARRGR